MSVFAISVIQTPLDHVWPPVDTDEQLKRPHNTNGELQIATDKTKPYKS